MSLKIFSHRGLISKKSQENSLNSLQDAQKQGFKAIEFDIWYLKNQLVLKHNRPQNLNHLTQLSEVFTHFGNAVEYWLDFKNLNSRNCESALKLLKKMIDDLKIKPSQIYFAPFILDFKKAQKIYEIIRNNFGNKAQIVAVLEILEKSDYQNFYQKLKTNNIYGLSIQYKNINLEFRKIFYDIKIFAWTVNDKETADILEKIGVENIASDKLKPKQIS